MTRTDWLFIGLGALWIALFAALAVNDRAPDVTGSSPEIAASTAQRLGVARPAEGVAVAQRAASAPRAVPETSGRFEYLRYAVDTSDVTPRACLTFSAPLDPARDYSAYVALDPAGPAALSVSGQTLCVGGLQFGEERDLVLRAGLPAADGRTLATEERTAVDFGDRPAFVTFAGSGVILPRRDADGLAIETVNVDAVEIAVKRVNDRALVFKRITQGNAVAEGDWGYLYDEEDPWNVGELVWEGEMAIEGPRNAPVTTVFPLAAAIGRLEPGAYYVEVTQKKAGESYAGQPASARRWILFTDLALTTYDGADGLDVVLRSLQTARPLANAELSLLARNNEILSTARSDRTGRVHFGEEVMRGDGPLAPRLVVAYSLEGDFAALDLESAPVDLSGEAVAGRAARSGADVYVYLDRGIYRPGETVRASAMLRDAQARAIDRPGSFVVYRPNGIEAERIRFPAADAGRAPAPPGAAFHDYDVPRNAARGMWRIALELDGLGEVGSERFSVEDFVPQRVALELSADTDTPIAADEIRAIEADARFLYGAPGAGLAMEGEARVAVDPSPFAGYRDYSFGRHDEQFAEQRIDLPPAVADGAGKALIALDLGGAGVGSSKPLRVTAVVGVEEPGGRAVRDSVIAPYRPNTVYLGLDPSFDGESAPRNAGTSFEVVALDPSGEQVAAEADWWLLRVDWDYDWWRDEYGEWRWRRTREVTEINAGRLAIPDGGTGTVAVAGLDWGDYELIVSDPASGAQASRGFWAGWGGRAEDGVEAPDRVRVTAPEQAVDVGGSAEFSILPPYAGEAEVVVATDRVLASRTVSVPEGGANVAFEVTEEWGAGAYVMVSVFTPRDPVAMPRPRRAVGVAYAPVDVTARTFEIALAAPDVVRPRQTVDVRILTSGATPGENAWLTLAAVDEGVLRLTGFASPDPEAWYFGKKALGLALRDDYGRLLDPNQGAAAPVRAGGDQLGGEGLTVVPTRTVALFSGPVRLGRDGAATVPLEVPDFNGELRLMAVVWSPGAVGGGDRALTVRDPVPAELVLPRFLAPGDEALATATVDNVEGEGGAYSILLSSEGLEVADLPVGAELAQGERRDVRTPVGAVEAGVDEVSLMVTGPGGFSIARSYPIETRSPYLPARSVSRAVMDPGDTFAPAANLLAGYVPGSAEVTVSFSPIPLDAAALYASLDEYPYGCTEQLTSRALPLLYAGEIAALADRQTSGRAAFVLQEAVTTILNRQSTDGTIGLWRIGDGYASPWLGAYAVDFLSRAKAAGYAVPDAALDRALSSLSRVADGDLSGGGGYDYFVADFRGQQDNYNRMRDRSRAYALYVLAREGRADVSRLRYVHDQELRGIESPLARAQIAAALAFVGDRARSASAFDAAVDALGFRNDGDYYQTPRRDLAGVLALAAEAGARDVVEALAEDVAEQLPDPQELSTQEKAFLLLAAHALLDGREGPEINANGATETVGRSGRYELTLAQLQNGVAFENEGDAPVWRTVMTRGAPVTAPPAAAEGVAAEKRVRRLDGAPANLAEIAQGDRLVVSIVLSPRERRLQPLIVADLLPAGFEIEAVLRPEDAGDSGAYAWLGDVAQAKIAEARDDRFLAAIDVRGEARTLAYVVRAVTPGSFAAPGVVVEDMYRADVFARTDAFRVDIAGRS
jgi:uncharacterized protein YfaS (alpha-2-macroglobulin family)